MRVMHGKGFNTWRIDVAGIAACVALTFAAWLAGAEPLMSRHEQNVQRTEQLSRERDKQRQLVASKRDLKARLTSVEEILEKSQVALQPAKLVNQRIAALTALANETGLETQSINTGTLINGARFSQLPIHMTSTGRYRTAALLLHKIQQTFHDTAVTGFELSDNTSDSAESSFSIELVWYVVPSESK